MSDAAIEEWIETDDGVRLWSATSGTGPPLVLCHGGPGLWDDQKPVAEAVGDLATVHRWEQRGCGRSTDLGPYTVARFIVDLETLREHFGHDRWLVGGHSWGATLALRYAFAHPERVAALLYMSGTGVGKAWRRASHEEADRRLTEEQRQRLDELEVRNRNDDEEREYRILSWATGYADRSRAFEFAAKEAATPFKINYECNAALNAETKTWKETDLLARCRTLDIPVLVVHGAEDPRPRWALDSMIEALPQAESYVIHNAGHTPWAENPEHFFGIARRFLRRVTTE